MDESPTKISAFKYWNQIVIEKYLIFLASIQILLIIVMLISYFYQKLYTFEAWGKKCATF